MCHKNVLGNVVHTKVTKVAVELYKAQMISALVLLILKSDNKAELLLLQLLQTQLLLLRYFCKIMPLDLQDLIFTGPEY